MMRPTPGLRPSMFQRTLLAAGAALLGLASAVAHAQTWPTKPVSLVVPFPTGGTTDVLARALAERLTPVLGQTVIVESKPGAGATLGADYVAKARPDGYTLLVGAVHHTIATSVYKKLPYDFQKDLTPLTVIAMVPNVLAVNASSPAKTVTELVALAKSAKPEFSYGSNGNGTAQHLIGTQFENMTGAKLLHVPYKGSGPLTTDLLGGQVTMSFDTITPVLPHIKAGKLRALAVTTGKRSSALPEVPTLAESGLAGFDIGTWFGVLAPAGTPQEIVARLSSEMIKIIHSPEFRMRMEQIGAEPIGNTPEQMAAQIRSDTDKFARLVKQANSRSRRAWRRPYARGPLVPASERNLHLCVIGTGIVGVCIAAWLQRDGHRITFVDPRGPGEACSFGNAGSLSPSACLPVGMPGMWKQLPRWLRDPLGPLAIRPGYLPRLLPWLLRFLRHSSRDEVVRIATAMRGLLAPIFDSYAPLVERAGAEALVRRTGCLYVYSSPEAAARWAWGMNLRRSLGVELQEVDAATLEGLEPDLRGRFRFGLLAPENGSTPDPSALVKSSWPPAPGRRPWPLRSARACRWRRSAATTSPCTARTWRCATR